MAGRDMSAKERRMYEDIKESAKKQGRYKGREEEVAARTVMKKRRQEGRTEKQEGARSRRKKQKAEPRRRAKSRTSKARQDLAQMNKTDLYRRARRLGIAGRSRMNKAQLVRALRKAG